VVRLYLPAAAAPVEIESIRFLAPGRAAAIRAWDFAETRDQP
jgi:hypothetical protein